MKNKGVIPLKPGRRDLYKNEKQRRLAIKNKAQETCIEIKNKGVWPLNPVTRDLHTFQK